MNRKATSSLPLPKKILFYLISYTIIIIVAFSLLEVLARLKGFRPFTVKQADIVVEPGGKFFTSHPTLGYTNLPGKFKVTLAGTYSFRATNLDNTLRVTHALDDSNLTAAKEEVWVFGDSITYGWSVNDEESYSWLLQERFPNYEIVNFGVSGYGTLHSLIQLREALQTGRKPRLVILAYASWHDVRNTFTRSRRKLILPSSHLGPVNQPYARLTDDGRLEIFRDAEAYREFPFARHSAFINALEEIYDGYEERHARSHEVTKAILKEIFDLCRANRIELIVAALTYDATTSDTLEYCEREGVKTVSMFVDLTIKANNNLPYDSHPSAIAHQQYAQKLESVLRAGL